MYFPLKKINCFVTPTNLTYYKKKQMNKQKYSKNVLNYSRFCYDYFFFLMMCSLSKHYWSVRPTSQ